MLPQQDEISTGLDSATTFQIVRNFRDFAHLVGGTVLIALLQPAPEVFNLFDDVMLLSEGALDMQCRARSFCQLMSVQKQNTGKLEYAECRCIEREEPFRKCSLTVGFKAMPGVLA